MALSTPKEERIAFEDMVEGFSDGLAASEMVTIYKTDQQMMERTNDIIWRPMPYIAQTFSGTDQTTNFRDYTGLSVPATIGFSRAAPWVMTAKEMRVAIEEKRLGDAAKQKLASDVNVSILNVAALQGTLVVQRTAAAAGFDDVAQADAIMNEQGVQGFNRYLALNTRDYNNMASNLAARQCMDKKPATAYERAYVGDIAGFETYKLDYANRLTAAAGGAGITMSTLDAGGNFYTPVARRTATTGESSNVDNRYQTITVNSTASVAAGDAFTVAALNAVHHITKGDTGQLKTFRVISVDSGTTMTISPPMITAQGGTDAELQYQNCVINTKAANSAIVWLNKVTTGVNCFWQKEGIELLPGRYAVPSDAGVQIMRATTEQGIEVVMQKSYDIKTMKILYRLDIMYGVAMVQPEMCGIMLFGQT